MKEPFTLARARGVAARSSTAAVVAGSLVGAVVGTATTPGRGVTAGLVVAATSVSAALAAVRLRVTDPRA